MVFQKHKLNTRSQKAPENHLLLVLTVQKTDVHNVTVSVVFW